MGAFIDDKNLINDNAAAFAKRVKSQYSIFSDKTPTFCYYFHVNSIQSTKDSGLQNVEKLTGKDAATKYDLIKDLPLYGIEQIALSLEDSDEVGYNTDFDGEAILLPSTIKPVPDDYFMITTVGEKFFFRVTEVNYDTIVSHNFYRLSFTIKAADDETYYASFLEQVRDTYKANFRKYGTEEQFILKEADYELGENILGIYNKVAEEYKRRFYNEKYNALMVRDPNSPSMIYDAFVNYFCNQQHILAKDWNNLYNIMLYIECRDDFLDAYMDNSIFGMVPDKDKEMLESDMHWKYCYKIPTISDSIFKYYGDYTVRGVMLDPSDTNMFGGENYCPLPEKLMDMIHNKKYETGNILYDVISAWFNDNIHMIGVLIKRYEERKGRYKFVTSYENLILVPIFLYILYEFRGTVVNKKDNVKTTD